MMFYLMPLLSASVDFLQIPGVKKHPGKKERMKLKEQGVIFDTADESSRELKLPFKGM